MKNKINKNAVLGILLVAQLMDMLDGSIVNVALPTIYQSLHFASVSALQWITSGYMLAYGGFLLLGGRLADLFGRKRVFLIGTLLFTLASLVAALAQNPLMMQIARGIQGFSAAFMSPAALSIILSTFTETKERNRALGMWGGVAAAGGALGLILGGVVTEFIGWRWNFLINVPIGLVLLVTALRFIPETHNNPADRRRLDISGAVFATSGLLSLLYGLTTVPDSGWTSGRALTFLLGGAALLAAFIVRERYAVQPILPMKIFKIANVAAADLSFFMTVAGMSSLFFLLSLYMQNILGFSPLRTGLGFLPVLVIIGIVSTVMTKAISRIGYKYPIVVGLLPMAAGMVMLAQIHLHGSYVQTVLPGLSLVAFGAGIIYVALMVASTNGVPARQSGLAAALMNTSQQLGGAFGLAVLASVASSVSNNYLAHHAMTPQAVVQSQLAGYSQAFYVAAFMLLAASITVLIVIRQRDGEEVVFNPNAVAGV